MERIKSIMTDELAATKSLSKLKIDPTQSSNKNVNKAISYIQRRIKPEDLNLTLLVEAIKNIIEENVNENNFVEVDERDRINNAWANVTFDYVVESEKSDEVDKMYFDMRGKLAPSKNAGGYSWRDNYEKFQVFNAKRLIAIHILWEKISDEDTDSELKKYFVGNYLRKRKGWYMLPSKDIVILEMIMDKLQEELNIELMTKYEKETKREIATALKTKKNIKDGVLKAMEESKFLNHGFTFVEYDNDTDLEKVDRLEVEWGAQKEKLTSIDNMPSLRFRKLGKHKAWGLYSPSHNTIAIDIRNVNSFIHEYGHLIDYQLQDENLSMMNDFKPIIQSYRKEIFDQLDKDSYVMKKVDYYVTPTEVFARAFEIYMAGILKDSSFLKSEEDYQTLDEYKVFTEENKILINDFMNRYLG